MDMLIVRSFLGITAAEEYGGMSMGYQAHCIVLEEISRASGRQRSFGIIPYCLYVQVALAFHMRRIRSYVLTNYVSMLAQYKKKGFYRALYQEIKSEP